jgi:hypothetical protein
MIHISIKTDVTMEETGTNTGVTGIRGIPVAAMSENAETQVGGTGRKIAICTIGTRGKARKAVGMRSTSQRGMGSGTRG